MTIIYKVIENTSSLQFLEVQPGEINDPGGVDRWKSDNLSIHELDFALPLRNRPSRLVHGNPTEWFNFFWRQFSVFVSNF